MACVEEGVHGRAFDYPNRYVGFCDPSGGSSDSMMLAIAHKAGDTAMLDAVREIRLCMAFTIENPSEPHLNYFFTVSPF
jgi:hypothetical protein